MNRFAFSLSTLFPSDAPREPLVQRRHMTELPLWLDDAVDKGHPPDADAPGCGWFESSLDLQRGLIVSEVTPGAWAGLDV